MSAALVGDSIHVHLKLCDEMMNESTELMKKAMGSEFDRFVASIWYN